MPARPPSTESPEIPLDPARRGSAPSWRVAAIVLAAAVLVAWSGALANGFVWDDEWLILMNPDLSVGHLSQLLARPTAILSDANSVAYYRPILSLSLALDSLLWGRHAWGFHLTSLLLHFGVGFLLFAAGRRLLGDRPESGWAALAASAAFVLHPAHVEPVVYVSGRNDSLAAIFCLAAILAWLRPGPRAALVAAAATTLALFTKEAALLLPVSLIAMDLLARRGGPIAERALRWGGQAVTAGLYLAVRAVVLAGSPARLPTTLSVGEYLRTAPAAVVYYLGSLLWPGLHTNHQEAILPVASLFDLRLLAGLATIGAMAALALLLRRREPDAIPALVLTAAFGFVFPLAFPLLSAFESAFPACERFLYLGSIGVALAVAFPLRRLFERLRAKPRSILVAGIPAVLLAALWSLGSQSRAADWRDSARLFETLKQSAPWSANVRYYLGLSRQRQGRLEEAIEEYEESVRLAATNLPARNNLALLYDQSGNTARAEAHYRTALATDPNQTLIRYNLATLLQRSGRLDEAADQYRQAIARNPLLADAHLNLGETLAQMGDRPAAFVAYREALRIAPGYGPAHARYGTALAAAGQRDEGILEMRRGLELDPGDDRVRSDLAAALTDASQAEEAVVLLKESLTRWPDDARALYNAGNALRAVGRREEAVEAYRRSLAIAPGYGRAINNLGVTLTELGRNDDALTAFDQLVQLEPGSARAHNNRGVALRKLAREREARKEFESALRIDPGYAEPARHLREAPPSKTS